MPKAYYVTMIDKFLSGWGMAEGKLNRLIFECDSREEAEIVAENARNRTDQKNIKIVAERPYFPPSRNYVQVKTKDEYARWYEPNVKW